MIKFNGRIPIIINPTFWLISGFISFSNCFDMPSFVIWMAIITLSILVHEFGHACTALLFGQRSVIELVMLGGLTTRKGKRLKFWQEFLVVLNGPMAGFLLCVCGIYLRTYFFLGEEYYLLHYALSVMIRVNIMWGILNLIPVIPLDGGHLLSILLEAALGVRGVKIGLAISIILAVAIGFFAYVTLGLFGALFLIFAFENYRALRNYNVMTEDDRKSSVQKEFYDAKTLYSKGYYPEALDAFHGVRSSVRKKKGVVYSMATQYIAEILHRQGHDQQAYELLMEVRHSLLFEGLHLLHNLAYRLGDYKTAIQVGNTCFRSNANHETALLNSFANANHGNVQATVGWLRCAQRMGIADVAYIVQKQEYDGIREHAKFKTFVESLHE